MSDTLNLINKVEPFTLIPTSTSVAEALTHFTSVPFALIGNTNNPRTLVQTNHLQALAGTGDQPLVDVLEHLPPLMAITKDAVISLDTTGLELVALVLQPTNTPGLVVYHHHQAIGVLSRKSIREALSPSAIFSAADEREGLYGDPHTQAQCYICPQCKEEEQAQYIFSLDQGSDVMNCPLDPSHGHMELYEE